MLTKEFIINYREELPNINSSRVLKTMRNSLDKEITNTHNIKNPSLKDIEDATELRNEYTLKINRILG